MSQKANYFKLGLFVIGAVVAGVAVLVIIGSGRWLTPRAVMETYFNESVQGLDIGSKMKYRGVVIGEVTRISFTYVKYEQDKPMNQRKRYVLVEARLEPRLVGGRAANDIASPESSRIEVERGLRVHLAPQGITGTNYLELDYVDALPAPVLPIDWVPDNIYIPSTPSTVSTFVNAASEIIDRLHRLDIETTVANLNKLLVTAIDRVGSLDTAGISKGVATLTQRADRTLAKIETTLDGVAAKKLSDEAVGLLAELRQTNGELQTFLANPAFRKLPDDTSAALAGVRQLVSDPKLPQSIAHMERTLARLDRIFGTGEADLTTTFDNLRQITDNLRDLTEDAKRYPSNLLFGAPPRPLERTP
jgi:ABC-type transporter Mla subunit MlaD